MSSSNNAISPIDQDPESLVVPAAFSEGSLAMDFVEAHGEDIRYVPEWGKWFRWDGQRWRCDKLRQVESMVRKFCFRISSYCPTKLARTLASAKTVAAVLRLVQQDERIKASIDLWDSDPWLLNTPGGVVDLRNGGLSDHDPTHYCTKMTAVVPGGPCPMWQTFLQRVVPDGDQRLYLQRAFGYALTGVTTEQALFFFYGTGANGKSVALNTIAGILADYSQTAPMETFTTSFGDRHPTEIAGLIGARLVTTIETEEGKQWAESRIKTLTGSDPVSARFAAQARLTACHDGLRLSGRHTDYDYDQHISVVWTPCRFGGSQPFFICTGQPRSSCSKRVTKLHSLGGVFLCRHCHGLAYACQSERTWDRKARRADKLRMRLGGEPGIFRPFPPRPRGMWWRTYQRLATKAEAAASAAEYAFLDR